MREGRSQKGNFIPTFREQLKTGPARDRHGAGGRKMEGLGCKEGGVSKVGNGQKCLTEERTSEKAKRLLESEIRKQLVT